jgi:hypothetical protein
MCNRLAIVFKIKTMKTKTMKKQKRENNSKLFTKTEMQTGENIRELYKHSMLHHGLNTDNDEFRLSFFFFFAFISPLDDQALLHVHPAIKELALSLFPL